MKQPAAFRATYADMKLVKTRQVAQLIFEIPLAEFDSAYDVLGGLPNPANERWFGIAPLDLTQKHIDAKPAKRDWRDVQPAQQAGIRCADAAFAAFLKEKHPDDWHESQDPAACVRLICQVNSRVELGTDQRKRVIWNQLDSEFEVWKLAEQVGA